MTTIAVIDDDPGIRTLVGVRLQRAGYTVISERNGQAGLEAMQRMAPDLAILDWMMPRKSGPDVCVDMRSDPQLSNVPVLMLTARVLASDMAEAKRVGVDAFMTKPFSAKELMETVDRLLAEARLRPPTPGRRVG